MLNEKKKRGEWRLRENEKFFAFILLILTIVVLVVIASNFDKGAANDLVTQAKLRIIDSAIAGLMAIAGMAAQALFRTNSAEASLIKTNETLSDKVPPLTGEAAQQEKVEELPEYAR